MNKILCPTDFSKTASNSIAYSAKLAQRLGAELTLFNVQSLAELTPDEMLLGKSLNVGATGARLEEQCDEVRKVFKISCNGQVATSVASVNKLISSRTDGLVVMGSNGADYLAQFFLGSNTYQVVKKYSTPLIIIPEGCEYSYIRTIVYAFDYRRNDRLPLTQLVFLTKALRTDLRVLQIMEESYSRKAEEEIIEQQEILLDLYKDDIPITFDTIYEANFTDSLHSHVLRNKTDLLALCTEDHGFLGKLFHKSVVNELSWKTTYPLFVFHA